MARRHRGVAHDEERHAAGRGRKGGRRVGRLCEDEVGRVRRPHVPAQANRDAHNWLRLDGVLNALVVEQGLRKVGTVKHLRALLVDILEHETTARRCKELPEEAALPQQVKRNLGVLGTVDEDAAEVEKCALFSADELDAKAEQEMQRRVAAGISDSVEDLNGGVNGGAAPAFDQQLVGKRLEVLWPYTDQETGDKKLIWASGRVARVADGLSDKRSPHTQTVLPAGMVLWVWDADPEFEEQAGEKWLALLPNKWNKHQVYGWRYEYELRPKRVRHRSTSSAAARRARRR